jgi:hypothetical protein
LPDHTTTIVQTFYKREGLAEKPAQTYFDQQRAEQPRQGRWGQSLERPYIVGSEPIVSPPAGPQWLSDPVPPEEPLGECVDWLPDMTTLNGAPREEPSEPPPAEFDEPTHQPQPTWRRTL